MSGCELWPKLHSARQLILSHSALPPPPPSESSLPSPAVLVLARLPCGPRVSPLAVVSKQEADTGVSAKSRAGRRDFAGFTLKYFFNSCFIYEIPAWPHATHKCGEKQTAYFADCVCWGVCVFLCARMFAEVSDYVCVSWKDCVGLYLSAFPQTSAQTSVSTASFFQTQPTSSGSSHTIVPDKGVVC